MNYRSSNKTPKLEDILKYFGLDLSIMKNLTQRKIIELLQAYYSEVGASK